MSTREDATATGAPDGGDSAYRLPSAVAPRRYELHLVPDLDESTFTGSEQIELEIFEEVDRIVLNAAELAVGGATLTRGWARDGNERGEPLALEAALEAETERVAFASEARIAPGRYTLSCTFSGILNDRLHGFYRSTFVDDKGETRVIAATQFEETHARRAFPCFDEPAAKASFSVLLDVPSGTIGLSNGPELSVEELGGGRRRVRFGETIPMSTYLVAFVVGPLELTEPRDVGGIPVRVAHPPGRAHLTGPALDAAEHALGFFADYFALAYPAEKLDLVALPDFAAGAMENLGCVTFREAILLADPEATGRAELERLAEVVEHELAHMWFGDLVTMRWWNGIWLNEAFATFMALRCQDDYRPEWKVFTGFARSKATALGIDGLHATRPVEFPVRKPEDAAAMFDALTYEKGASVLWMIEQYVGPERFRAGVRRYLAAHAYSNTETTDLWDAIGAEVPDVPVREVMESWLLQGGYPLVSATTALGENGAESVQLAQEPFSYLPPEASGSTVTGEAGSSIGSHWLVPILAAPVRAGREVDEPLRVLLTDKPVLVEGAMPSGPIVVNAGGAGFYRVAYDHSLQSALLAELEELPPLERFSLVGDAWATVLAGRSGLAEFFDVLRRLSTEQDPHVWSLATGALGLIDLVCAEQDRDVVSEFTRLLLEPQLARVGWLAQKGEDEQTPLLRSTLVSSLGILGEDAGVLHVARQLFAADHANGDPLAPDLASAVLGVVAAYATQGELDATLSRYRRPRDPMDGIRHLYSLARLRDPVLVSEVLELSLSEIRSQNAPLLLGALLSNRDAGPAAFDFIRDRFQEMVARFPSNLIHRMLDGMSGLAQLDGNGQPRYAAAVRQFCDEAVEGSRRRLVDQSLERLEVNVRFAQRIRGQLAPLLSR